MKKRHQGHRYDWKRAVSRCEARADCHVLKEFGRPGPAKDGARLDWRRRQVLLVVIADISSNEAMRRPVLALTTRLLPSHLQILKDEIKQNPTARKQQAQAPAGMTAMSTCAFCAVSIEAQACPVPRPPLLLIKLRRAPAWES